jgi:hypothetical protein
MKHLLLLLCASTLIASGSFALAASPAEVKADVDRRVQAWQPTKAERRIDEIAWASDIRTALRQSEESRRPVFLFTHDGRMGVGRQ